MQIQNNLNSMMQYEKVLDKSAHNVSKLGLEPESINNTSLKDVDLAKEMVTQIEIPIAYTANAEVISTKDSLQKTLLDIKA